MSKVGFEPTPSIEDQKPYVNRSKLQHLSLAP